ncbi:MAG: RluA family pseudouridine synthase [Dehalococcoidia bacterium]
MSEPIRRFRAGHADRLDRLMATAVPDISRAQAQKLIAQGHVRVDETTASRPAYAVGAGSVVEVCVPDRGVDMAAAASYPLQVLYEDEHVVIIDKQPGLIVHPVPGLTGVTLVDVMRARYPELAAIDGERPGVVHRLDRETSGVLAYAKTAIAQQTLKDQWRHRETVKLYLTLAAGRIEPPAGIIDAPLGLDPLDPRKRAVVEEGDSAHTEYRVREQYSDEAALLEVRIYTGRTHQIRVHLEAVGHPVLGDTLYGLPSPLIARQALHAWRLGLRLPSTDEWREFEAPLPADMQAAVADLRDRHGFDASDRLVDVPEDGRP